MDYFQNIKQYNQCIEGYTLQKDKLNQFILLNVMSQLKEEDLNGKEVFQRQLDEELKQFQGYTFLLKLMIDLQEKSCLSDDNQQIQQNINGKENDELINKSTVQLFKEWTKEKYPVSVEYFNQQQLQLYIDGFQSVLILSILPEIVKFYDLNESLPYQPTGLDLGNKYNAFKLNLQIYITQIDLVLELEEALTIGEQKKKIILKDPLEIGKSQFSIQKGKSEQYGDVFVVMKECKNQDDQNMHLMQQIREISILSKLPQNDYIIQYKHHQVNDRSFQLFLEYFDGETLLSYLNKSVENKEEINNNENLKIERLNICIEILKAANHLHQLNIVHGDLKLANILIKINNKQIRVKIIDFSESGFLVEKTTGYTVGYEEKSDFNDESQIKGLFSEYFQKYGEIKSKSDDILSSERNELKNINQSLIPVGESVLSKTTQTCKNNTNQLNNEEEKIDQIESHSKDLKPNYTQQECQLSESLISKTSQTSRNNTNQLNNEEKKIDETESHPQDLKPINTQLEYQFSLLQEQFSDTTVHKKDQNTIQDSEGLCPYMNIQFQCDSSENNKLNVENTRQDEKQNDQPISQRTQLSNLEKYFIQQDKQEFYPRIFVRLKQININFRKIHSQLKNFNDLKSIEKIFLIAKLIGANNRHLFVSDFLKIAKGMDLFYHLIKKNPIKSEIKKKIMNYYLSYEN
ncbi:hypothetical protein ABPG74_020233 [Tetrahymena malaccensis]